MPSINLLPWREAERKKRQRDFGVATGGAVVAAIAVVVGTIFAYSQMISGQEARNKRLTDEIVELEKSITEIDGLERQKERLLARMEIIEELQKSRPEIVHLFDELVRQLPEGVYLTGMKQTGSRVEIRGVAQSSTRVSALMRQIDASNWLADPEVERVETKQSGASRQAEFVVYLKQQYSGAETEDAE
ncbi:MAG: PilN domain-containing protein [Gammaproteobacteria bacterium]|nr:PilN domain-containing protein [Gammaproteobacteria bacterium]MBU2676184.1 PilN domain-containing protein [Gammaproteobacteria bacterium]NNC57443.1 pilus assembly protein PilN [Woeseiaceae bacterium]NNL49920.1 pilus assembly protein PilN [Woeseiaceae bacterium]